MWFSIRGTRDGAAAEHIIFALDTAHALRIAQEYGLQDAAARQVAGPPRLDPEDDPPGQPPEP